MVDIFLPSPSPFPPPPPLLPPPPPGPPPLCGRDSRSPWAAIVATRSQSSSTTFNGRLDLRPGEHSSPSTLARRPGASSTSVRLPCADWQRSPPSTSRSVSATSQTRNAMSRRWKRRVSSCVAGTICTGTFDPSQEGRVMYMSMSAILGQPGSGSTFSSETTCASTTTHATPTRGRSARRRWYGMTTDGDTQTQRATSSWPSWTQPRGAAAG